MFVAEENYLPHLVPNDKFEIKCLSTSEGFQQFMDMKIKYLPSC